MFYVYPTVHQYGKSITIQFVTISKSDFQFINTHTKLALVSRNFQKCNVSVSGGLLGGYTEKREKASVIHAW